MFKMPTFPGLQDAHGHLANCIFTMYSQCVQDAHGRLRKMVHYQRTSFCVTMVIVYIVAMLS